MNRRQFCFAFSGAVALLAGARPGHAECGSSGIIEFVNTIWQKQARLLAAQTPPSQEENDAQLHAPRPYLKDSRSAGS